MIKSFLIHYRFDKRITEFAEEKFKRDGIDVKLGSMVVKVGEKDISSKERGSGQVVTIPHGMVVWSTGIGARPEIIDFMKQLGQVCLVCVPLNSKFSAVVRE
jgi:NADH:ubiquinone reductase (non-electrogenic)